MTVVETTVAELAAVREHGHRRLDAALVAALIVVVQAVWIGAIGYAAYRIVG
jgi:hypothetical protein